MSMTKTTNEMIAPIKAQKAMKIVATLEAAAAPKRPKTNAKNAKPPAIGWRIRV